MACADDPSSGGGGFLPPSSAQRPVRGGIRLQARRGKAAWWATRWLAAIEAGAVGERWAQGRADARRGQVVDLDYTINGIAATVQGTRREPEHVAIRVTAIDQPTWLRIVEAIAGDGAARAELLVGKMPEGIESLVRREGVELFPQLGDDLQLECTCSDWSAPCRHVVAVALLAAELMEADPLLAFRVRGIEPALLRALLQGRAAEVDTPVDPASVDAPVAVDDVGGAASFWGEPLVAPVPLHLDPPALDAPLVRILGAPPLWRGADSFEPALRRIHAHVATDGRTLDAALATPPKPPTDGLVTQRGVLGDDG